ncbi:MAG: hypothetical protein U9N57_01005 [Pseudomonadota bacterium]|nr:hypothetical protein [Pseudomonadota bacterium]
MKFKVSALVAALALTGCSTIDTKDQLNEDTLKEYRLNKQKADAALREITTKKEVELYQVSDLPFVSKRSVKKQPPLPEVFLSEVLWVFPESEGGVKLQTLKRMLHQKTGYKVWVDDDLRSDTPVVPPIMPLTDSAGMDVSQLTMVSAPALEEQKNESDEELVIYLDFKGRLPVKRVLDSITSQTGLEWTINHDEHAIEFKKYFTKTFPIEKAINHEGIVPSTIFVGGQGDSSEARSQPLVKLWASLQEQINTFLSIGGKVAISEVTGTVTVTDNKATLNRVESYIKELNKSLRSEVLFNVEIIEYQFYDQANKSMDFTLQQLIGSDQFRISTVAGLMSGAILTPEGDVKKGSWQGSSAVIDALNKTGHVTKSMQFPVRAMNNQVGSINNTNLQGYVATSTPAIVNANGTTQGGGLQLGYIQSGQAINILPHILDDGDSVSVNIGMNLSALNRLDEVTSGDQSLQSPNADIKKLNESLKLQNGQTAILLPIVERVAENEKSGWFDSSFWWLGGGDSRKVMLKATVVTVTPYIFN